MNRLNKIAAWIMVISLFATAVPTSAMASSTIGVDDSLIQENEDRAYSEEVATEDADDGQLAEDTSDLNTEAENEISDEDLVIEENMDESDSTEMEISEEEVVLDEYVEASESDVYTEESFEETQDILELFSSAANKEAPYSATTKEALEQMAAGDYTITANIYVPGESNTVLPGVTAYLTNPKWPFASSTKVRDVPTEPQTYNAVLHISESKEITLEIELKNPCFQALKIAGTEETKIINTVYADNTDDGYALGCNTNKEPYIYTTYNDGNNRITKLTVSFADNNYSGLYSLGECTEFASPFYFMSPETATEDQYLWNVSLGLAIDFDSLGKEPEESETTYYWDDSIGAALQIDKKLPDGVTVDLHAVTEGEVYEQILDYLKSHITKSTGEAGLYYTNKRGKTFPRFHIFYAGLEKDGKPLANAKQYQMTFISTEDQPNMGWPDMNDEAYFRWVNGEPTTILQDVYSRESEDRNIITNGGKLSKVVDGVEITSDMYEMALWEEGTFPGGYVVIISDAACLGYESSWEDAATGVEATYRGTYVTGVVSSEAELRYDVVTTKNNYGYEDEKLKQKIQEIGNYQALNLLSTYQVGFYDKQQSDKTAYKRSQLAGIKGGTGIKLALPIEGTSDVQIYKVIYNTVSGEYVSVELIDYSINEKNKAEFWAVPISEPNDQMFVYNWSDALATMYAAVEPEYVISSKDNSRVAGCIQYYAIATEGATEKPTAATTEFTYNGANQSLGILESANYTVSGSISEKVNGEYTTTVTLNEGYVWSDGTTGPLTFTWKINALKADDPSAVTGLQYTGSAQTGVNGGTGYNLAGTYTAKDVGTYQATAVLAEGYEWSDGSSAPKSISWSIDKADQTVSAKTASKSYKLNTVKGKKQTFSIGASAEGKVSYAVTGTPSSKAKKYISVSKDGKVTLKKGAPAGTYTVTISAAETATSKAATKTVTITVNKNKQTIKAKVSKKNLKVKNLKKKKATFSIGAKAKGKLSYAVSSTPSNGKKYISVSKKGKVTMKKGAPKGTYKITVTAKATSTYAKATKTITVTVK